MTTMDDPVSGSTASLQLGDMSAQANSSADLQSNATSPVQASAHSDTTDQPGTVDPTMDQPSQAPADQPTASATSDVEASQAGTQSDASPTTGRKSDSPTLDHVFVGLDGVPISGLKYKFESDGTFIDGTTDSNGNTAAISSFSTGSDCTVSVLTDSGLYKQVACYVVPAVDSSATLMSGSMVLESETQQHGGAPDEAAGEPPVLVNPSDPQTHPAYSTGNPSTSGSKAPSDSASVPQSPNLATGGAAPSKPKGGTGKPAPPKVTKTGSDTLGHPQAAPAETFMDWAGHQVHSAWHYIEDLFGFDSNPVAGKAVPTKISASTTETGRSNSSVLQSFDALKNLVSIAEEQTEHSMPSSATVVNLKKFADGSMTYGSKPSRLSKGQCYMYVKIALWRANAIKFVKNKKGEFDAAGGSYAKVAGDFLMSQGFANVTNQLPDARWALPGDVIVYHVKGDAETADGHGKPGHIDIRTYHYYVSDFKRNYLCFSGGGGTHFYEVSGIYRKSGFSDPLALARMKAFLKIIRSREAKAFFTLGGDDKTYFASQGVYRLQNGIKDFSTYPSNPEKQEDHQGAYQLARSSWSRGHAPDTGALPKDFTPQTQDRYAVWLMEGEPGRFGPKPYPPIPSALGYVRQGDIDQAVSLLRKRQWPSLPGGNQDQKYTWDEMKADFAKYLKEYGAA